MDKKMIAIFTKRISESEMTKKHLSKITGIDYRHLLRILTNRAKMTASEMLMISKVLGISNDEIKCTYARG